MSFVNKLRRMQEDKTPIVVYGAGNTADSLLEFLSLEYSDLNIIGCAVSDDVPGLNHMRNLPVNNIKYYGIYKDKVHVFVAVVDKYLADVLKKLEEYGFSKIVKLTFESENWEELRERYFVESATGFSGNYQTLEQSLITNNNGELDDSPRIYMACSHVDKKLSSSFDPTYSSTLLPIQVGKALTDKDIAPFHDDEGDNISYRNKGYSELTALYWLWKNEKCKWIGLCHYRRHFAITVAQLDSLINSPVDIVLTVPIINFPSVQDIYFRDHEKTDWQNMLEVLENMYPDYRNAAEKFFHGNYYCGYNMFIARKDIMDEYCAWLFPLLERIEEYHVSHADSYQRRYVGFLAERLFSLYFLGEIKSYRIVFARKRFYL